MKPPKLKAQRRIILIVLSCASVVPGQAMACGPGPEIVIFPLVALIWMAALIPVEISIIKKNGEFPVGGAIKAYIVLLLAKIVGLLAVWPFLDWMILGKFGLIDLIYGLIHGTISMVLLNRIYHRKGAQLWKTSLLISTVIPWSYRLVLIALLYSIVEWSR